MRLEKCSEHVTDLRCARAHVILEVTIRDDEPIRNWLREHTLTWENNISTISETAGKYIQESYDAVVREIQSDWIFIQPVPWDTGDAFARVEKIIRETFLPRLFFGKKKTLSPIVGDLSTMLVKKYGLGLLNPVTSEHA